MNKSIQYAINILAVLIASLLFFSSCIVWEPAKFSFDYEELKNQVDKVELINYDNNESKQIDVKDLSLILPFDFDKMEIIETLNESQIENFIEEFCEVTFITTGYFYNSTKGISLKVTYKNGDFILIATAKQSKGYFHFLTIFNSEGIAKDIFSQFFGRDRYINLVNKYFDTKIE